MLRNLSNSYSKIGKYQEQITTGRKFTRPSDDPVSTVKGMAFRTDLNKAEQFTRNIQTVNNWLDTTDDALDQAGTALHRIKELLVQAANDTNTSSDRTKIKEEIEQIKLQLRDIANTKVGNKYIFSGTKTLAPVFDESDMTGHINEEIVQIEVFDGIKLDVNIPGKTLFGNIDNFMSNLSNLLNDDTKTGEDISEMLGDLDQLYEEVLAARADIGARQNRVELMTNRLALHETNVTKQLSENEDVDYAKAITEMITAESIHQAALSVGAKIIQQTLVDFIR
jgi:flagellar hook-associated protein 3 FlgL